LRRAGRYLRKKKHDYVDGHRFGDGPNWRFRTIRAAFDGLGARGGPRPAILNDYILRRNLPDEHQLIRDLFEHAN
jgi:hypothetical protein